MKHVIVTATFLLACFGLSGQQYYKLLDNTVWNCQGTNFNLTWTYQYVPSTDSIWNSNTYKKYNGFYLLREDTNSRKVYMKPPLTSQEILLYDFGLVVGDTFRIFVTANNFAITIVTQKDSVLTMAGYRKRWLVQSQQQNPAFTVEIIEGVGSTEEPLQVHHFPSDPIYELQCEFQNNVQVYNSPNLACGSSSVNPCEVNVSLATPYIQCADFCSYTAVASMNGTGPYQFSWIPSGQNNALASALCAGTYTVIGTDLGIGCTDTTIFSIGEPDSIFTNPNLSNASCPTCCDGSISLAVTGGIGPYNYSWSPGNYTVSNPVGLCAGSYTVCITDLANCVQCDTITVIAPNGVGNLFDAHEVRIFPNPASEVVYISINELDFGLEYKVEIRTVIGQQILAERSVKKDITLDISSIPQGTYLISILSDRFTYTRSLIIQ
jgi:hypothetical protein